MAVTTIKAQVEIALNLKNKISSTYLGIGRTTPWVDEENPPTPDRARKELDEPIGYKRANLVSLCRRVDSEEDASNATLSYRGELWELVPDEEAVELGATHVYFETRLQGRELPSGEYRQVGMFTDLVPKIGFNKSNLLPKEVEDIGTLQFFENRQRQNRTEDTNVVERFIISVAERR